MPLAKPGSSDPRTPGPRYVSGCEQIIASAGRSALLMDLARQVPVPSRAVAPKVLILGVDSAEKTHEGTRLREGEGAREALPYPCTFLRLGTPARCPLST